jgi:hypothetical protein
MGDQVSLPGPTFNGSIRIESRPDRLTSDAGAILLREAAEKIGLFTWLGSYLEDPRDQDRIVHPLVEMLRTMVLLNAQGWRDQNDADTLRNDPAFRISVSERGGDAPLRPADDDPDGLASQPTLSRLVLALSSPWNRQVLNEALVVSSARRRQALGQSGPVVIDLDSLALEVHGLQEGSEYNGHYHARVFHPLVASLGDERDLVGIWLRHGAAHTAEEAEDRLMAVLARVEKHVGPVSCVRIDAGFPSEPLLASMEERGTPYVARIKNNAALYRMAGHRLMAMLPFPTEEPRYRFTEMSYAAGSWSRERRIVLVVEEIPGELVPRGFFLLTSFTAEEMPPAELLELYRKRGNAESSFGEWLTTIHPALSSAARPKSHYRHQAPKRSATPRDGFAANETLLLLAALAYQLVHVVRTFAQAATGTGWSLQRTREQILKVAARILLGGRRVTIVIAAAAAHTWTALWNFLGGLSPPERHAPSA